MPHRTTFVRSIIPDLYFREKAKVTETINREDSKQLMSMGVTTDCWTSISNESYISFTLHYLTESFELNNSMDTFNIKIVDSLFFIYQKVQPAASFPLDKEWIQELLLLSTSSENSLDNLSSTQRKVLLSNTKSLTSCEA